MARLLCGWTWKLSPDILLVVRKPYTITKQRERWSEDEHLKFLEALKMYGRAWRRIEEHIGTKTAVQIRSHAQKFFSKLVRGSSNKGVSSTERADDIEIPPPRPKRKPRHPYPRKAAGTSDQSGSPASNEGDVFPSVVSSVPLLSLGDGPCKGHIQAMMQLSKILYARGFYITFVITEYIQERFVASGSVDSVKSWPGFRFEAIPDGLPPEHGRTSNIPELCRSFTDNGPLHLDNLIDKLKHSQPDVPPVTCIISDGVVSFPQKTARKLGVPRACFWTASACGFCPFFFAPLLVEKGYIRGRDDDKCLTDGCMEQLITCIPGMPPLQVKDLPFSLRHKDMSEILIREVQAAPEADFVLLNTFDELDRPILDALRERLPALYTIGPLALQAESGNDKISESSASLWTEETECVKWLDCQKPCSVIYICFGSLAVMTDQELLELAWGLEASGQPFLWVIRPDLIHGHSAVLPSEFLEKVKDRSFLVSWAAQMKVLSHPSVGGFLTHSGWNSTLESICAGVPMISWPFLGEQPTNRRFVSGVWNIGMAMNEVVRREDVEDMVRRLMSGEEGKQMGKRIGELRDEAMRAVGKGGSSYANMEKFLKEIKMGLIDS